VTLAQAQTTFQTIASRLQRTYPEAWTSRGQPISLTVVPHSPVTFELKSAVVGASLLVMALVGTVLLIVCFNLLNFLLARALTRRREMAIRLALGASRRRLVQQLLTETFLLATVSAVLGLIVAYVAKHALVAFTPNIGVPLELDLSLDHRVFGLCLALVAITTVACGLLPALRASTPAPGPTLKEGDFALSSAPSRSRLWSWLLVMQVAASLVLLLCSGLFLRSLERLYSIDLGFDPRNVALLSIDLGGAGYTAETRTTFTANALSRLQALSGVEAVTLAARVPMGQNRGRIELRRAESSRATDSEGFFAGFNSVGFDYFRTMHIPLQRGRTFAVNDETQQVVVVNDKLARDLWSDQNPLGQRLQTESGATVEVIGVAKTTAYDQIGEPPLRFVYFPLNPSSQRVLTLHVRTHAAPERLLGRLRQEVLTIDPRVSIFDIQTMEQHISDSLLPVRLGAILLSVFGALGLFLVSIGLYGVMAYMVNHRQKEIGIRLALGATPRTVVMTILKQGMALTGLGIVIGTLVGSGITAVVASEFYGLTPTDITTLVGILLTQMAIALMACWVPARRAMKVNAVLALRNE
jgi:predicted permease